MSDDGRALSFGEVTLDNWKEIYAYTSEYGEGSCQHSPVSMYSLAGKYRDSVCIEDGFLFVLRSGLCDDTYRVYLAPMGKGDLKKAYWRILSDAAGYGKKVRFLTLTKTQAEFLRTSFPERFDFTNDGNLAEYIFSVETMRDFPGKAHARRRTEIRSFWRDFGDRTEVSLTRIRILY
jgi:hypothetical protein